MREEGLSRGGSRAERRERFWDKPKEGVTWGKDNASLGKGYYTQPRKEMDEQMREGTSRGRLQEGK